MSMLNQREILQLVQEGRVRIEPLDKGNVKAASVDLLLDTTYFTFKKLDRPLTMSDYEHSGDALEKHTGKNCIELAPGDALLCQTQEYISLPEDVSGLIIPRGRTVLRGLNLSLSTGMVKPGTKEKQLFFLVTNAGPNRVQLKTHDKICQLVLFRL
jgi:deoxycytidine triphosphate deaminase